MPGYSLGDELLRVLHLLQVYNKSIIEGYTSFREYIPEVPEVNSRVFRRGGAGVPLTCLDS